MSEQSTIVLSEIEKIEAEQNAAAGESGSSTGSSRKRKHTDDTNRPEDVFAPQSDILSALCPRVP